MPLKWSMWGKAKEKSQPWRCPEKDEYQAGKFSTLEGKQKLMWNTDTSPPATTN